MEYLWLVLVFILGIMMLIVPNLLWEIEHIFTVKKGKPTELYLTLMRIGGTFFIVASVICAVVVFL